jgi:hypothetical protein
MSYLNSSHFSHRFRHIICQSLLYGFKDSNYSILNRKGKKSFYYHLNSRLIYLFIVVYVGNWLKLKKDVQHQRIGVNMIDMVVLSTKCHFFHGS